MSPGAVSHIRARATSGRSARPRTIICSTASRLCDSATANMTFCNDATSIAPLLRVRDTSVKQLVQILVDALASEIPTRAGYWPCRRSPSRDKSFYSQGQAYTDPQLVQDGLFSRPRIPGPHVLPESSRGSGDHAANSLPNRADISSLADTSARFLRHSSNRPMPEPSLTFLILVIYNCCPDLDGCGTVVAQRLPRPFRLDSLACRKDF